MQQEDFAEQAEERKVLMVLSQIYIEWENQAIQQERRSTIESLMQLRFGSIDESLENIIPNLMALSNAEYTSLLLQLSKEALIQHFQ
jgi:hypothetical protein